MKENILNWFKKYPSITKGLNLLTRLSLIFCLFLWAFKSKIESMFNVVFLIDLEALFAVISGISLFLNKILTELLKDSEFSPSYALATGYVKNFISPVITQLIENGISAPKIYIFKPQNFEDLSSDNIDRMKAELKNKEYNLKTIKLSTKHSRARDILIINKLNEEQVYFDFPNTLLSLFAYVDYKLDKKPNTKAEDEKEKIVIELIDKFYEKLDDLLIEYRIQNNVHICDNKLNQF